MDRRLWKILARLSVHHLHQKFLMCLTEGTYFAPAMSVDQFLPCLNDIAVLLLSTSKGEVLNFFSLGYSLNCSSSSEVSHHPTTLQMLIPPADTRLAAKKGRSSFRGRLLTHTNLVT